MLKTSDLVFQGIDVRKSARVAVSPTLDLDCELTALGSSGFVASRCIVSDLGQGGALVMVPRRVADEVVGAQIVMRLTYPGADFQIGGTVRHVQRRLLRSFLGIEFLRDDLYEESSLWLARCLARCRRMQATAGT